MDRLNGGTQTDRFATTWTTSRSREHHLKSQSQQLLALTNATSSNASMDYSATKRHAAPTSSFDDDARSPPGQPDRTQRFPTPGTTSRHNAAKQQRQQKRTQIHGRARQASVSRHITASKPRLRAPTSSQPIKQDWPPHRGWRRCHCPTARYCGPSRILTPNRMIPTPTPIRP